MTQRGRGARVTRPKQERADEPGAAENEVTEELVAELDAATEGPEASVQPGATGQPEAAEDGAGFETVGQLLSGNRRVSRAELRERAARAASGFAALGVGQDDHVAILLRNDFSFFEASLAAQVLKAHAVPVNWHLSGPETGYILADCGAQVLVVHADLLHGIEGDLPEEVEILVVETPPEIAQAYAVKPSHTRVPSGRINWQAFVRAYEPWDPGPEQALSRNAPAAMVYTSGTTGQPKGVRRRPPTEEQLPTLRRIGSEVLSLHRGMRTVVASPLYHSGPNAYGLGAVRVGGTVVLQPRFDAEELLALVEEHRITHLNLVPTMFVRLLRLPDAVKTKYDLTSLTRVTHAAAPCPPDIKRAMIDWWGPIILEYYGGTESGVITACTSEEWLTHPGTVGRPVEGAVVRILGGSGEEMATGEIGEVYMRNHAYGDFTYHGRDDERKRIERQGLITCGDMGYVDQDGFLYLCDRKRDMVISGGVNIYPAEIEAVLLSHPGVRDCAVFGIPDDEFGESVAAVVQPQPDNRPSVEELQSYLRRQLAGYKIPRRIEFRTELPREDSGKIFKRKLRDPYWQGTGRRI